MLWFGARFFLTMCVCVFDVTNFGIAATVEYLSSVDVYFSCLRCIEIYILLSFLMTVAPDE